MDKLVRNIIIGVVAVLLLISAYVAISVIPGRIQQSEIEESESETGDVLIMSSSIDYIRSVKVTNGNGSYTFEKNDSTLSLTLILPSVTSTPTTEDIKNLVTECPLFA